MNYVYLLLLIGLLSQSINASKLLPTGKYDVGSASHFIIDKERPEYLSKYKSDFRRIAIQTFFPSNKTGKCNNQLQSPYGKKMKYSHCLDWDIRTPKNNNKYPVVILSPGLGGSHLMNMTLAEELASHGYYVINVGYTYFNSTPAFPDGKKIKLMSMDTLEMESQNFLDKSFKTILNRYIKTQKNDIITVLNKLPTTLIQEHLELIDLTNIACVGYSAGGAASAEVCSTDKRVKAGININGVLYGDAWKDSIQQPFLYINADYSNPKKEEVEILGGQHVVDSLMRFYNHRKNQLSQKAKNDFYELTIFNTTHHNFSDWALIDQSLCGKANPKKSLEKTYLYIELFLDEYLKGKASEELNTLHKTENYHFEVIKTVTN